MATTGVGNGAVWFERPFRLTVFEEAPGVDSGQIGGRSGQYAADL